MVNESVLRLANEIAKEMAQQGADAVALMGSHVRGDAHAESDIDLVVVGDGPDYTLSRRSGFLVSVSWVTAEQSRNVHLSHPGEVCATVPGWRRAMLIHDPNGVGAAIQRESREWTWARVEKQADEWIADELTGLAEEVHKLATALKRRRRYTAAAQRNALALRMAGLLAVHRRILFETENVLWDVVADAMGDDWRTLQDAALSMDGTSFAESCDAALALYAATARETFDLLSDQQRTVVTHACALAGHPVE